MCWNAEQPGGRRIFVIDQIAKQRYLVDRGTDICCYPRYDLLGPHPSISFELSVVNRSTIDTYGSLHWNIQLKNSLHDLHWNFVIANAAEPIIGSDFLAHYNILPDCHSDCLVDSTKGRPTPGQRTTDQQPNIKVLSVDDRSPYYAILAEFPGLKRPSRVPRNMQHTTVHYIRTSLNPRFFAVPVASPRPHAHSRNRVKSDAPRRHRPSLQRPTGLITSPCPEEDHWLTPM
nr:uncharacterized protein LOC119159436 [Rhipicephalus microplus]